MREDLIQIFTSWLYNLYNLLMGNSSVKSKNTIEY